MTLSFNFLQTTFSSDTANAIDLVASKFQELFEIAKKKKRFFLKQKLTQK